MLDDANSQEVFKRSVVAFDAVTSGDTWNFRLQNLQDRKYADQAGAQFERWVDNVNDGNPRIESNILQHAIATTHNQIVSNKPSITFSANSNDKQLKSIAAMKTDRFRFEFNKPEASEAFKMATYEAVVGGFGAMAIEVIEKKDKTKETKFTNIPDADRCVFWECPLNEPKYNASKCWVLTAYTEEEFTKLYPDASPASWSNPISRNYLDFFYQTTDRVVQVATYYEREKKRVKYEVYKDSSGLEEIEIATSQMNDSILLDLLDRGFTRVKAIYKTQEQLHHYTMCGGGMLEDHGIISGKYMPVVEFYTNRVVIDSKEQFFGIIRKSKDLQDLLNYSISNILQIASISPVNTVVIPADAVKGNEDAWNNLHRDKPAYVTAKVLTSDGQIVWSPANISASVLPTPSIPQGLTDSLTFAKAILDSQLSFIDANQQQKIQTASSGVALDIQQNQVDQRLFGVIDNIGTAVQKMALVWLDLSQYVYSEADRVLQTMDDEGNKNTQSINQNTLDGILNAFSTDDDFTIEYFIGPSPSARRNSLINKLLSLIPLADEKTKQVLLMKIMQNLEGTGTESISEYARKSLIQLGIEKPREDDEPPQQPEPDPLHDLTRAETEKTLAEIRDNNLKSIAKYKLDEASAEEKLLKNAMLISQLKDSELQRLLTIVREIIPEQSSQNQLQVSQPPVADSLQQVAAFQGNENGNQQLSPN